MKTRIINFWEILQSSYWFLPILMLISAIGLSFVTLEIDGTVDGNIVRELGWIYTGGPDGARTLLSVIASSMITVAGVVFSITIVALTLASSQFGPRLLNNFMRDTGNQIVLGTFIATFMYCLLVMGTIRGVEENGIVPHLSITFGIILAIASLVVLIYFIHHVSISIQAENVIAAVGDDLDQAIERQFPEEKTYYPFEQELRQEGDLPKDFEQKSKAIDATGSGYLQTIDYNGLMELATEYNLLLKIEYRPGDFVTQGSAVVKAGSPEQLNQKITEEITNAFIFGTQRLRLQDIEFAINQLVEIAVRALSPGINDPFTAMTCVDRLGVALTLLVQKIIPSAYRYDEGDNLRLIMDAVTFESLADSAFNQIRQYGRSSVAVTIRLLETIAVIGAQTTTNGEREVLLHHAEMIKRSSEEILPERCDRKDVEKRFQIVRTILDSA